MRSCAAWTCALVISSLLVLSGPLGCSEDTGSNVLAKSNDGWQLTEQDLAARFAEVYPDYPYETASLDERKLFLRNVVNNDVLVEVAKSEIPELAWPAARRVRVESEEFLVNQMFQELMGGKRVSDEDLASVRVHLGKEVRLHRIVPTNEEVARICYDALLNGMPFDEAYQQYGLHTDELRTSFDTGWVTADKVPFELVTEVFLSGREPGDMIPPTRTTKGVWIVQIIDERDVELDPRQIRRVDTVIRFLCYGDSVEASRDRLTEASGYETFPQNFPVINQCFNAYWDSMSKEQPRANANVYMSWKSPAWLLPPEARDLPIYTFYGDTGTAYDFMEELNATNTLNWPSGGDRDSRSNEIRLRIRQYFLRKEAERRGILDRPEYQRFLAKSTDEAYLDDYFDRVVSQGVVVTPDEALAELDANPEVYRSGERVAFGYLAFAPGDEAKARDFAERTQDMTYFDWKNEARTLSEDDSTVVYRRDTGMIELEVPLRNEFLQPLVDIARGMETGDLTDVISIEGHGYAIVRCNYRRHTKPYPKEVGLPMAEARVRERKVDAKIGVILEDAMKRRGIEVHPERLTVLSPADAKSAASPS
ncbi:MAG: peptidylprolyl isomerase [Candidatus Eisenbacteria bacterium]